VFDTGGADPPSTAAIQERAGGDEDGGDEAGGDQVDRHEGGEASGRAFA
jgi:hypothetical protein